MCHALESPRSLIMSVDSLYIHWNLLSCVVLCCAHLPVPISLRHSQSDVQRELNVHGSDAFAQWQFEFQAKRQQFLWQFLFSQSTQSTRSTQSTQSTQSTSLNVPNVPNVPRVWRDFEHCFERRSFETRRLVYPAELQSQTRQRMLSHRGPQQTIHGKDWYNLGWSYPVTAETAGHSRPRKSTPPVSGRNSEHPNDAESLFGELHHWKLDAFWSWKCRKTEARQMLPQTHPPSNHRGSWQVWCTVVWSFVIPCDT